MIKELTDAQMDHLLRAQAYGRLGCGNADRMYMVPLSYVYDGQYIVGHSKEGKKISLMRENPKVCFQVDEIQSMTKWWSIILWAEYEELDGSEKSKAVELLNDRFAAYTSSAAVTPTPSDPLMKGHVEKNVQPIIFRLKITDKSGRMEKF